MKKLLFLISLCLLSQNFTIAQESSGNKLKAGVPVPGANTVSFMEEPVPARPKFILQNEKPAVLNQPEKTQQPKQETNAQPLKISGPPVPMSKEELEKRYVEARTVKDTYEDQEKYKIYEPKKLNLWAEKKSNRPPVIVEDNLSNPEETPEVRAKITRVEFSPSRVFSQEELQQLAAPLLSQPVTIADIQKVINGITRCYILGDYATSKAYLTEF